MTDEGDTVEPMMVVKDRKAKLQALHTDSANKAVMSHERNVVLNGRPPSITNSEKDLTGKERSTLAQLRSGYGGLLSSYKNRINKDASLNVCADCGMTPHDVKHLFDCNDTVRFMKQTVVRYPGTQLSRGERPKLK